MTDTSWAAIVCAVFAAVFGRVASDDVRLWRAMHDWRFGFVAVALAIFATLCACTALWLLFQFQ
jgi:anti-sigma-K factor RskA